MKKVTLFTIFTVFSIFVATTIAFAWGNKKATGEITNIDHAGGVVPFATVQGYTEGGKLWLGFSFKCGSGDWEDRKPKKVKDRFTETFNMRTCPQGYTAIRSCLWKGKNGGLMEGRVDCYDN